MSRREFDDFIVVCTIQQQQLTLVNTCFMMMVIIAVPIRMTTRLKQMMIVTHLRLKPR
jgi:hypothetical protein